MIKDKNNDNYIYYLVGVNLKRLRKEKGLTQERFADKCNYSPGFIRNIESENYFISFSLSTVYDFAKALDVDVREFFKPVDKKDDSKKTNS